ncbi:serine/threonine-protein kinase ATM-like protein [Trifolium pratense]|uniref:Serine/threonine-protein kinase ATM-like protein n=1 Tax=Trifolium pratense TaxID=57577 RepID=A0A2K3KAS2_TRIPR|nr:serine/threonine-protein kinase ATM-like protein [Trifolium pratense]
MLYHLGMAWDLRWRTCQDDSRKFSLQKRNVSLEAVIPSIEQTWIIHSFRLPFIIDFDALHYLYCQTVVMAGYGLVLNFATDATAYEFARTIYSISTSSTSDFEL